MTLKQLAERVTALETELATVKAQLAKAQNPKPWLDTFGMFEDDPTFEDYAKEVQSYRDEDRRRTLEEMDREEAEAANATKPRKPRRSRANAGA